MQNTLHGKSPIYGKVFHDMPFGRFHGKQAVVAKISFKILEQSNSHFNHFQ